MFLFSFIDKSGFMCVFNSPGLWKLVAKFHSNPQESFSAHFEVKEYGNSH